ncbi:rhamnulokinase [Acidicapsa ligni]|uniref:rhamnulokinase n=1 Tax=Acidicapsa ligni TaxID=542300 RepID=UPI0021DF7AC2|nr:FGGY-family carbohydrate kinase [Acidicapsa ligni]
MSGTSHPQDRPAPDPRAPVARALVAIDLGAESCRISLLRWHEDRPEIQLLHRIANGPVQAGPSLHWPLDRILIGVEEGLRKAAASAPEGIRSIAVDGWAVDYVRLSPDGNPLHTPYCYRDERTNAAKAAADTRISPEELFAQTGAQPLRINTAYQLFADNRIGNHAGIDAQTPWLLLPEYILHWLGGRRIAEYTNATHTGLVDIQTKDWSRPIFARLGLSIEAAPPIVCSGSSVGKLTGPLAKLPAFADTELIAPACHDTASAIAAINSGSHTGMEHTAYIVSGTWSLVGTILDSPITSPAARHAGFTNQGSATGGYCFHSNVNGMWILKQCLDHWAQEGRILDLPTLIAEAAQINSIPGILNVDAPELLLAGEMPARINHELTSSSLAAIPATVPDIPGNEPIFARLIFASLAARYAVVLNNLQNLTGRTFHQITILGGGSRNALLSQLTSVSTGLPVITGEIEGSTIGNFAVQLAAKDPTHIPGQPPSPQLIHKWANRLAQKSNPTT